MPHPKRRIVGSVLIPLSLACGPLSPAPADTSTSSGSTAQEPEPTSDDPDQSGPPSSGPPPETTTTTTDQTSATSSSTSNDLDTSATGADTADSSTSSDTTAGDPAPCGAFCEPTPETCPPEAQVNTSVTGETPLGAFAATFAAQSLPNVFGASFYMVLVPSYTEGELCEQLPQLRLTLPNDCWASETELEVPAELLDGQDVVAVTTALLHNYDCTWWGFNCEACEGHVAFDLEIAAEGWSLAGSVDAGCCRTFYQNNSS